MIIIYIYSCLRIGTAPWRYWQINARYFSPEHGVFSKLSIDQLIPERWRLAQSVDTESLDPVNYPVFLKPEWGQNAHGIHRADNQSQLLELRTQLKDEPQRYLLQEAAQGHREFELFSIDSNYDDDEHDVFTVTEARNDNETFPINSKYNRSTRYVDITSEFSAEQQKSMANFLTEIGQFRISRMSVRADSNEDLVAGNFRVIEINLFLPMPINLLDESYTALEKWRFIRNSMMRLAHATKLIKRSEIKHPIFASMMLYGRSKNKSTDSKKPDTRNSELGERHIQS